MRMELWAIVPELILAGGFLLLLVAAPFFERGKSIVVYAAAVIMLALAAYYTVKMISWPNQAVFQNTYRLDRLSYFFKYYAVAGTALTLLACFDYFRNSKFRSDVPALLVATGLGAAMLAASTDFSLIVLFFQIIAVSTIILVGIIKTDRRANEAALKMFLFGAASTAVLLYGLSLIYGMNASANIGVSLSAWGRAFPGLAIAIVLVGFGFKMASAPFHMWAPDVYEGAPAPVSGFLSVLPKAAAAAIVLRLVNAGLTPIEPIWRHGLEVLAAMSMTVGNVWALRQTNLKRMLAYSSIAQIGYVLAAISVSGASSDASGAALLYLAAYLFMNLGAFFVIAKIEAERSTTEISECRGLFRRSPLSALAFTGFLLSLAGVPPFAGFVAKVLVLKVVLPVSSWLAVTMAVNFVVAVYYYLRVIGAMYLEAPETVAGFEQNLGLDSAIWISFLLTIVAGISPDWLIHLSSSPLG